jgi:Ras-related C3 botulinum toxin substrate 1
MICFSLVSPDSLDNVQNMWIPELKEHCPNVPYILLGLKSDLRDIVAANPEEWKENGAQAIPSSKGEALKKLIGAQAYLECSAKKQINMKEVFNQAVTVVLHPPAQDAGKTEDADFAVCKCLLL